jgi:hypothetical protein
VVSGGLLHTFPSQNMIEGGQIFLCMYQSRYKLPSRNMIEDRFDIDRQKLIRKKKKVKSTKQIWNPISYKRLKNRFE